jgi:hypothetical protein
MACGCQKPKQSPYGTVPPRDPEPAPEPPKDAGRTQSFKLDMDSGRSLRFGSKLEAEAARVRNGGRGTVRPA